MKKGMVVGFIVIMFFSCSGLNIRSDAKINYRSFIEYKNKGEYWDELEFYYLHSLYLDCISAKTEGIDAPECNMVDFNKEFSIMKEKYAINKKFPDILVIPDSFYTIYTGKSGLSPMNNPYVKAYAITGKIYNLGDMPITAVKVRYVLFDNFNKPLATGTIETSFTGHPYYKPIEKNKLAAIKSENYFDDISPNNVGYVTLAVENAR